MGVNFLDIEWFDYEFAVIEKKREGEISKHTISAGLGRMREREKGHYSITWSNAVTFTFTKLFFSIKVISCIKRGFLFFLNKSPVNLYNGEVFRLAPRSLLW